MTDISDFQRLIAGDNGLVVVSTLRDDATIASSVVNAGVLPHPVSGDPVVAMVLMGASRKLAHLRQRPRATVAVRVSWAWATAEGRADLIGPADPAEGFGPDRIRLLLREIYHAAGGVHDDLDEYDRVMAAEGRTAVLIHPERVYSNPSR